MKGQAPHRIEFRWVYRPPIPAGLDPAAREALVMERIEEIFEEIDRSSSNEPFDLDSAEHHVRPVWDEPREVAPSS
jgi:hypothetical protein